MYPSPPDDSERGHRHSNPYDQWGGLQPQSHAEGELERPLGHPPGTNDDDPVQNDSSDMMQPAAAPPSPADTGVFASQAPLSPREAGLPTSEVRARREAESNAAQKTSARLLWLFALLALFVLVRFNLSPIVEEVQYALTRGEQRAESDHARTQLQMNLTDASEAFRLVYKAVGPSVVHIDVTSRLAQNRRRRGFGPQVAAGQGSGVILDKEGYILTNYHVIEGAQKINVKLSDGRTITNARVVGEDEHTDLAVIKISADGLIASPWGDSEKLQVGDWVVAVGNPFGLDRSVTAGIVSAKRRDRVVRGMVYQSFLQTDAAVNPGNSGGPLVNLDGEVVGITAAIVGEAYQGVSLAIPSEIAKDIYHRLREHGTVDRGWLGIEMAPVTPEEALARNLPPHGVRVQKTVGRPAIRAGLRVGDVITKWNDAEVTDQQDLMMKVAQTEIGSTATLEIIREDDQRIELQVKVEQRTRFD
ncbi:MAG: trypsin-like peptidase domain-containing protein [Pirellulales bacterium]|nr:trypsin-like peptidase domain-containing protein [Pirellulales bacterium]